jgi:hypothetical protein
MSSIPEVIQLQETKKRLELAKAFQDDMGAYFFEHTMYDIKDALTSILALCDMADMKQIPQVKQYIKRVTDLLQDVRVYHERTIFNLNHVIINVINILKKNYKDRISFKYDLSLMEAYTKSSQEHLEQVVLYALVEAVETCPEGLSVSVDLVQRERNALVNIKLRNFRFSNAIHKAISEFHKPDTFRMEIDSEGEDTEIDIRLPLSFDIKNDKGKALARSHSVELKNIRKKTLYGAQERT